MHPICAAGRVHNLDDVYIPEGVPHETRNELATALGQDVQVGSEMQIESQWTTACATETADMPDWP